VSITIRSNVTKVGASFRRLARKFPGSIDFATRELGVEAQILFEKTTATWTHQPAFTNQKTRQGYTIGTDDEIYKFVDEGTRAHPIYPVRAKALRWTGPYHAKTKPGVVASFAGGHGRIVVFAKYVKRHPGTKARGFSKIIRERIQRKAPDAMRRALRTVTASEGFGI